MSNGGVVRRPAVPPPVRIRRDVNNLTNTDPIVVLYDKAIGVMKSRNLLPGIAPANNVNNLVDPTSWRYQGAIHDYATVPDPPRPDKIDVRPPPTGRTGDPFASANDKFPGDQDKYWAQCQHANWFFLSWHRMYLHFFEKIIMNIVANEPGGSTWALPYWNYTTSPLLPAPFRTPATFPNLFVPQRIKAANDGNSFLHPGDISLNCLKSKGFVDDFGGGKDRSHFGADTGQLESVPHNQVHTAFGGGSFMLDPAKAALDPIFWLHHCNIDRLWEVWVQRQKMLHRLDRNPKMPGTMADTPPGWLDEPFDFHDATGTAVTMTTGEVLNTRVAPLSYEYEDLSDPFKNAT
jgi:tyrosinase